MKNVSSYFEERTARLLGQQANQLFSGPEQPVRGVTVNTRLITPEEFERNPPFPIRQSGFAGANFRLTDQDTRLGLHPWHHAGVYYGQEPSASTAAVALQVQPGDRVLDLCAAPGGKTAQLAAGLQGKGLLVSNEYDPARSRVLLSNCERMGAENIVIFNEDSARIAQVFTGFFNKVLVDAPCSGEGMFRKEPQAVTQHCEGLVKQCAVMQAEILDNAACCLVPGGEMVYSTCTFSPDEDEGQIGAFLARHPDFSLVSTGLEYGCAGHENHCVNGKIDVSLVRRFYPCHGGEGHFVAKLHREGEALLPQYPTAKPVKLPNQPVEFLRQYFPSIPAERVQCFQSGFYLPPEQALPRTDRLHIVRCGIWLGDMEKDRFVPAHALAHAFGSSCTNTEQLTASDGRTAAYLRGEEIDAVTARGGWCVVCVDGFPLGWGKVSGTRVKNHYPKGLRNQK